MDIITDTEVFGLISKCDPSCVVDTMEGVPCEDGEGAENRNGARSLPGLGLRCGLLAKDPGCESLS